MYYKFVEYAVNEKNRREKEKKAKRKLEKSQNAVPFGVDIEDIDQSPDSKKKKSSMMMEKDLESQGLLSRASPFKNKISPLAQPEKKEEEEEEDLFQQDSDEEVPIRDAEALNNLPAKVEPEDFRN